MKLTKDDFDIHKCTPTEFYMVIANYNPYEVIEQILKNQKKAEKWDTITPVPTNDETPIPTGMKLEYLRKENKRLKEQLKTCHDMMLAAKKRGDDLTALLGKTKEDD